ncbi:hypothetical protein SAMN04488564_103133 [Lentzea waywayandensis]|uniref:Uncharacterized protein n=1 Tax=Lentzea waywayandensis TaxID=84724 RepID=A0A1I6DVB4_9PSEU|nr:hypothetical protein SAMN04488564_103133 [Lentzea waywayandensis]
MCGPLLVRLVTKPPHQRAPLRNAPPPNAPGVPSTRVWRRPRFWIRLAGSGAEPQESAAASPRTVTTYGQHNRHPPTQPGDDPQNRRARRRRPHDLRNATDPPSGCTTQATSPPKPDHPHPRDQHFPHPRRNPPKFLKTSATDRRNVRLCGCRKQHSQGTFGAVQGTRAACRRRGAKGRRGPIFAAKCGRTERESGPAALSFKHCLLWTASAGRGPAQAQARARLSSAQPRLLPGAALEQAQTHQ